MLRENMEISISDNVAVIDITNNSNFSFVVRFNETTQCYEYVCPGLNITELIYSASNLTEAIDDAFYDLKSQIVFQSQTSQNYL